MSNWGSNSIVVEGINGKNLYEKIMDSVEKCVEFKTRYIIDKVAGYTYTIEKEVEEDGKVQYQISVWKGDIIDNYKYPITWSWFYLSDIKLNNGYLSVDENFCHGFGGIEKYIYGTKLHKSGFYYYKICEGNVCGYTNDKFQKYFEMECIIFDITSKELTDLINEETTLIDRFFPEDYYYWDLKKQNEFEQRDELKEFWNELEKINKKIEKLNNEYIPVDFDKWSFEKKLSYCEKYSDNLIYDTTTVCDFAYYQ
jgi:hypothetical protein